MQEFTAACKAAVAAVRSQAPLPPALYTRAQECLHAAGMPVARPILALPSATETSGRAQSAADDSIKKDPTAHAVGALLLSPIGSSGIYVQPFILIRRADDTYINPATMRSPACTFVRCVELDASVQRLMALGTDAELHPGAVFLLPNATDAQTVTTTANLLDLPMATHLSDLYGIRLVCHFCASVCTEPLVCASCDAAVYCNMQCATGSRHAGACTV